MTQPQPAPQAHAPEFDLIAYLWHARGPAARPARLREDDLDAFLPAIARGDAEAFSAWAQRAGRTLRNSVRGYGAAVEPDDVVQETLLRLWLVAPRFVPDGHPNAFLRYGVRVAGNLARDGWRRRRRGPHTVWAADPEGICTELVSSDPRLRARIHLALDALHERPRTALRALLDARPGESLADLAARCGMRPNTFAQNLRRARAHLERTLRESGIDRGGDPLLQ